MQPRLVGLLHCQDHLGIQPAVFASAAGHIWFVSRPRLLHGLQHCHTSLRQASRSHRWYKTRRPQLMLTSFTCWCCHHRTTIGRMLHTTHVLVISLRSCCPNFSPSPSHQEAKRQTSISATHKQLPVWDTHPMRVHLSSKAPNFPRHQAQPQLRCQAGTR
jgi:hypothetical protein